jgi:hypothetical protein
LTFTAVVVVTHATTALVSGSDWFGAALPWMVLDALLIRAMARGSNFAAFASLGLALTALALVLAGFAGLVEVGNGGGTHLTVYLALAMAQSGTMIGLLISREGETAGTAPRPPLIGHASNP